MTLNAQEILNSVPAFVESVVSEARDLGVNVESFEIDHFCFRVETFAQYETYKNLFEAVGVLLTEAPISGRPIATYKLKQPVLWKNKKIPLVEIPAPKEGVHYPLGLEHLECVVSDPLSVFIQRYPGLNFDLRAMKKAMNPEIALNLPSGKSVKFHNQSLEAVIELEKKLG